METKEKNKLIAEFFGVKPSENDWYNGFDLKEAGLPFSPGIMGNGTNDLKFHSSWDWLIPVIKKIRSIINEDFCFSDFDNHRGMAERLNPYDYDIISIHKAVIEFIKRYNHILET